MTRWRKSGIIPSRGIYGINGNYIWVNKKNPKRVLEVQKVVGGGTSIVLHHGDGFTEMIPQSGTGFKHRRIALKYAKEYMQH